MMNTRNTSATITPAGLFIVISGMLASSFPSMPGRCIYYDIILSL